MAYTIGERIKEERERAGVTQQQLCDLFTPPLKRSSVSKWESGASNPDIDRLPVIAKKLKTTVEYLLTGKKEPSHWDENVSRISLPYQKQVPIINWVQAGHWNNQQPYEGEYEYVLSMFDTGPRGYALQVEGESMMPRYHPKDLIFVNPDHAPETGKRVIASCSSGTTFKELAMGDNGQLLLKALNEHWQPRYMPLEPDCHIIGVVVGSVRPE